MSDDLQLKHQMVTEALLILRSVEWTKKQIENKMTELDKIRESGDDLKAEEKAEEELFLLIKRIDTELINMDAFMRKYKKIINRKQNEKKTSLRDIGKKKQIRLRGLPTDTRGEKGCSGV